jgi:hypothetical protein
VMFDEMPSFGQIFVRACEEISCNLNDPSISVEVYCPMLHLGQLSDG